MADSYNLTGVWDGLYTYPYRLGQEHYTAVLFDHRGAVTGTIHETVTRFVPGPVDMNAGVSGTREGGAVEFVKTYDGTGGWRHSVVYSGRFRDGDEIEGVWRVDDVSGSFLMLRARQPAKAADIEAKVGRTKVRAAT